MCFCCVCVAFFFGEEMCMCFAGRKKWVLKCGCLVVVHKTKNYMNVHNNYFIFKKITMVTFSGIFVNLMHQ